MRYPGALAILVVLTVVACTPTPIPPTTGCTELPGVGAYTFTQVVAQASVYPDPGTGTPAFVDFDRVGGVPVEGGTPEQLITSLFRHELLAWLYETLNPAKHLRRGSDREVASWCVCAMAHATATDRQGNPAGAKERQS